MNQYKTLRGNAIPTKRTAKAGVKLNITKHDLQCIATSASVYLNRIEQEQEYSKGVSRMLGSIK